MLDEFTAALEKVASLGEEVARLEAGTVEQETAALKKLIAMIKPVSRYVDYPVQTYAFHAGQQYHRWEYEYLDERGIILVDNFTTKYSGYPDDRDTRGDYIGSQLVLTRSGKLLRLVRSGDWSKWQGEASQWNAKASEVTPHEAVKKYGLTEIVQGFVRAFREAISKAEKKQKTLGNRLEVLEQIKSTLG
ncbi:MAG: hypothetical protein AB1374_04890 [Bacillota bacterium]